MTKKRVILFLMIQLIKKMFNPGQAPSTSSGHSQDNKKKKQDDEKFSFAKNFDGAKQLKEMGKLGSKLILM